MAIPFDFLIYGDGRENGKKGVLLLPFGKRQAR